MRSYPLILLISALTISGYPFGENWAQTPLKSSPPVYQQPSKPVQGNPQPRTAQPANRPQPGLANPCAHQPDLEAVDISYDVSQGRLTVMIRNNCTVFQGSLGLRLIAMEALNPEPGAFAFDQTFSFPVRIAAGASQSIQITAFRWPAPLIDHPQLSFALQLDAGNRINEADENNNHYEKTLCVPCNARIESLSASTAYRSVQWHATGRFGSRRASKQLYLEKNGQRYLPDGGSLLRGNQWFVTLNNLAEGNYDVVVYCCDPAVNSQCKSNARRLTFTHHSCSGNDCLNADAQAEALAEDLQADGIVFNNAGSFAIVSVDISPTADGATVIGKCISTGPEPQRITHELWQGNRLVYTWPLNGADLLQSPPRWESTYTFLPRLQAGSYQYRCKVKLADGQERFKTKNFSFPLR